MDIFNVLSNYQLDELKNFHVSNRKHRDAQIITP